MRRTQRGFRQQRDKGPSGRVVWGPGEMTCRREGRDSPHSAPCPPCLLRAQMLEKVMWTRTRSLKTDTFPPASRSPAFRVFSALGGFASNSTRRKRRAQWGPCPRVGIALQAGQTPRSETATSGGTMTAHRGQLTCPSRPQPLTFRSCHPHVGLKDETKGSPKATATAEAQRRRQLPLPPSRPPAPACAVRALLQLGA